MSVQINRRAVLALLGSGCDSTALGADDESIRLARFPHSGYQYIASRILSEVYRRVGLNVKFESMTPRRATTEALAGRLDGEVSRILSYAEAAPGMVRVAPAFAYFTMAGFARRNLDIDKSGDLRKYRVGIIRGVQAAIELAAEAKAVEQAANSENLMQMLQAGRFDLAVDVDINGAAVAARLGYTEVRQVGAWLKTEGYHYLAPHRAALERDLSAVISKMKQSVELERLRASLLAEYMRNPFDPD